MSCGRVITKLKPSLLCFMAPKAKRPFSWFSSRNKVSVNSARRQKDLFSPLRSAIIWKVEEHALNRIPVSCVAAWMSSPPTTQHGSSKLPSLPPVTDTARHHLASTSSYSFQVFVFGSVCLGYTLGALKHLGNRWICFSPSSFGIFGMSENMVSMQDVNNLVDPSLRALA